MTQPDAPARCRAIPPKATTSWWMNDEQYAAVACRCDRERHEDKRHHCEHGDFSSYGAWERGDTP